MLLPTGCPAMQKLPDLKLSLEKLLLKYFRSMNLADYEAFCTEDARGVRVEASVDPPAEVQPPTPLVLPQLHMQDVSELDELVVAQVQPNQEAVAQEMLKRILLLTGKSHLVLPAMHQSRQSNNKGIGVSSLWDVVAVLIGYVTSGCAQVTFTETLAG